ncbi:MAG TPA: hypothetical protein VFF43_12795, partial [Caldimonas sp.]|nr:hypothetical protein [Caldimonas sp.]
APASTSVAREAVSVRTPWIADAIARIGRDEDLRSTMRQASSVLGDALFAREPWHAVALNRDAQPAAAASADASGRLLVATATAADDLATAVLTRAILNSVSDTGPPVDAEVVSISDAQLRAWTRQAGDAAEPGRDNADEDDRRVLWTAVLLLIGVESWIRRRGR